MKSPDRHDKDKHMKVNDITTRAFGTVYAKTSANPRTLYPHQKQAMANLDLMNKGGSFSTLVVLPTGGGKTYTASSWLIRNALDQKKKILWLAHRQMLLDQAAESFQAYAYKEIMPHISSFTYRIISGDTNHDRMINIQKSDDLLIVSKDSAGRNLKVLDKWLKDQKEIFLVVDEAHHSTAKTYRRVIEYVQKKVPAVKLIGLTATPFRTAETEQGLLSKIYRDGVLDHQVVKNESGIAYEIGLKNLINTGILARPVFEQAYTDQKYGESLGIDALRSIQELDELPQDIQQEIAKSAARNKLIVGKYLDKKKEYGQTLVFAVNIDHAIELATLFKKAGVAADYIVSDIRDAATGVRISREGNAKKIEEYRQGKLNVLINVNILTEGVDLPQTSTVFLARPTISTILMTQMVGRALRGRAAQGTDIAHIVYFIDNWNEHIAWVNPESIFTGSNEFTDNPVEKRNSEVRFISIAKMEEFASILDDAIDTTKLEAVPFEKRIPVGMYNFTYVEESGVDVRRPVMVYDSTRTAYDELMKSLPDLLESFAQKANPDEYLPGKILREMEEQCRETFFTGEMVPPYDSEDVISILKYYAQNSEAPAFSTFADIDRRRIDVTEIAQTLYDQGLGGKPRSDYLNQLWDDRDNNMLSTFFGRKIYFLNAVDIEERKIAYPGIYEEENNVTYGRRSLESLPLSEIGKINPDRERELRDGAFEKSKNENGEYVCAHCGMKSTSRVMFQVDHIVPMNRGGKSVPENLQILCRKCNGLKGDKL